MERAANLNLAVVFELPFVGQINQLKGKRCDQTNAIVGNFRMQGPRISLDPASRALSVRPIGIETVACANHKAQHGVDLRVPQMQMAAVRAESFV